MNLQRQITDFLPIAPPILPFKDSFTWEHLENNMNYIVYVGCKITFKKTFASRYIRMSICVVIDSNNRSSFLLGN